MSTTSYFWQGGRRIEIEQDAAAVTFHADSPEAATAAAERADVRIRQPQMAAPGLVQAELPHDRDGAMERLRRDQVLHHVYRVKDQPDNEILITESFFFKVKPGTDQATVQQYLRDERLEVAEIFGEGSFLVRVTEATGRNPIASANAAAARDMVEYAEPNLMRRLTRFQFLPSDPLFDNQWHLHAPADDVDLVAGAGIGAPEAWDRTRGLREIVIAVADDGFDLTHPDFQGQDKIAGRLNVRPVGADSGLAFDQDVHPRPGDYHGTPCAGVAVAEQNGEGTVGVAAGCAFYAVRFPLSVTDAQLARMFERISAEADVVSCSWGFGPADAPMATTLRDKISELAATGGRRGRGLVICVAAGNNNCPIRDLNNTRPYEFLDGFGFSRVYSGPIDRWIAAHPEVITVSASTSLKTRSAYSSWGAEINVCAPSNNFDDMQRINPRGRGIFTTDNEGFGAGTDFTAGSRYTGRFGGTSSATPTVAGVCGLALSANKALSAQQVRQIVEETASKDLDISSETPVNVAGDFDASGFSPWFGFGKVDADAAVAAAAALAADQGRVDRRAEDVPIDIPDTGQPVASTIEVEESGTIEDLRLEVEIEHTYIGDLRIDLIAPDGTSVTLQNHEGGSSHNLNRAFSPADTPALGALIGGQVEGDWRLSVVDTWFWDRGRLVAWRLAARVS